MVLINATDYVKFCRYLKDHPRGLDYPADVRRAMADYPSCEFVNGKDFGQGFRLNEQEAIMFKLRWS